MKSEARRKYTKKANGQKEPNTVSITQQHRKTGRGSSPQSLANLKPFQPGQSGNPGGNYKRAPKVSHAYARLLAMTPEEIENFKPSNGAEILAWEQFNNARSGKPADTLNATKEVTDRTEGRAHQKISVDNTSELERLIIRVQERILAQTGIELSRDEAIERIIAYRPELAGDLE